MRKRVVIMVVCVMGVVGAFLALTVLRGKSQPLASFVYLGTVTNLAGRYGRFSISNCCNRRCSVAEYRSSRSPNYVAVRRMRDTK